MKFSKRKPNRIPRYDYSTPGEYFITICTVNRRKIFWDIVGASIARPNYEYLNADGRTVERLIKEIPERYPAVNVDSYAVMPNHVHMLLRINCDENGRPMVAPTISTVVQQFKGRATKLIGHGLWQKSYYDHVVRDDADYKEIWEYIESNPSKWIEDELYEE